MKLRPTAAAAAAAPVAIDVGTLLRQAIDLLRNEHIEEAEQAFEDLLRQRPRHSDALHFMGVLRHTQGRVDEAVALIRDSLAEYPRNGSAWNNLGNILLLAERADEAAQAYEEAVQFADSDAEAAMALGNLGTLHRKLGALDRSETAIRGALQRQPDSGDAWYGLSLTLLKQGRLNDGLLAPSKAVVLWPQSLQPRHEIIRAVMLLGDLDRATQLLREWLAEDPDNAVAQHLLASCAQDGAHPERCSDGYVQQLFDGFAASFDSKLESLGYQAPALVVQALRDAVGEPAGALAVCDVGCGTGLCGSGLRPFARTLAGCDLSTGMLRRAQLLKVYDVLHKAELTHYLQTQPQAFDVVISADTLIYFGALDGVLAAAHQALKPGGWFIFTVEALDEERGQPHWLQPNGRYAHAGRYLREAMATAGFELTAMRADTMRKEAGIAVPGWVITGRWSASPSLSTVAA